MERPAARTGLARLVRPSSSSSMWKPPAAAASATNIIEIGAARVCGGRIVEEFQQLINPGQRLPAFITWLTGIDDAMLADQPPISDVWPHFMEFLGDSVIVAHNAAFDLGFLNAAARRTGQALAHPHLCTLRLARRLIPELRRRSLDVVAGHFGIRHHRPPSGVGRCPHHGRGVLSAAREHGGARRRPSRSSARSAAPRSRRPAVRLSAPARHRRAAASAAGHLSASSVRTGGCCTSARQRVCASASAAI